MDERTPIEKYKARRQLLANCDYSIAMLEGQRRRLSEECKELKAGLSPIPFDAIVDRVVLENADVLNRLSGKREATPNATNP